jgi:glycosyltransferase involved in cell wall biosynthesis
MSATYYLQSAETQAVPTRAPTGEAETTANHRRLLRVLYAIVLDPSRKFGSLEEQIFTLAQAFGARGSAFLPLFSAPPDPGTLRSYRDAGLEAAFLDLGNFRPATLERLVELIRTRGIEVVNWNFFPSLFSPYLWALSILTPHVRHYFTDHNSRTAPVVPGGAGWQAAVKRLFLKRYSRVIGVSEYVVDCLRQQGVWPCADSLIHFINTDRFVPDDTVRDEVRQRFGDENRFVLVTVAYLIAAKGVDVAIRAIAELPERVCLWIVGDGAEAGTLQSLARDLHVQNRVRFLGLQTQVQPFLQAADAFVCPSRWAEAAGLVNLEAQATGLPVLASDTGGIPEYVADGQSGFLFPVGDHRQLAERVQRLTADPSLCRNMSRAARELARRTYSVDARLGDYLALYEIASPD